jgi:hypothetical protein
MKKKQVTVIVSEKEEHVKMMQYPDKWPRWPILPMVRKTNADPLGNPGFIVDGDTDKFTVYKANIFMIPKDFETIPREIYLNFEEIFDAGWRVD